MPKTAPRKTPKKPQPFPHVPLPFTTFVKGLLQVDPKKLPSKKMAAKKKKGLSNRDNQAK